MEDLTPEDLEVVVGGDVSLLSKLSGHNHDDLRRAWARSSHPKLSARAVLRVLVALRRGEVTAKQVHDWAGFLFSGYSASATFPLKTLDFEYDPVDEDRIAEVMMRLEQMEDDLDGPISEVELDRMISKMEHGS